MPIINDFIKKSIAVSKRFKLRNLTPIDYQERMLRKLLRKASNTAFGKYYSFAKILEADNMIEVYQANVPIFDYDDIHDNWWHKTLNEEEDICWPGKIKYFALSSGTSGASTKHIPITMDIIKSHRRGSLRIIATLPNYDVPKTLYSKGFMLLGGSTELQNKGGYFVGDLSGITASKIPFWFRPFYKPGVKIASEKDWENRITKIAKNAPKWDIGVIGGIPSWIQLLMERIIEYHQVETIHDIWPNLEVYISGGILFEPYRKGFDKLCKKPLKIMDTYLASEGFVSIQKSLDAKGMSLLLKGGIFFEFVPFNTQNFDDNGKIIGNPKAYTVDNVSLNVDYAILLSTNAGAWRYLIGDTVRFVDLEKKQIIITGRTQHFLSICGEHLSVANMTDAITKVSETLNVTIPEFTVCGIEYENFFAHKWYIASDDEIDKVTFRTTLDDALKLLNEDYGVERSAVLKEIIIEIIPTEIFYKWHALEGKMGGQNKFPRVMKKEKFEKWEHFVISQVIH
jgi:hypothetical protein